jgi:quinolinate synthase
VKVVDIHDEIRRLKRERDAVLLAHYYQESEIQDLADHLGDSLALAQEAAKCKNRVIVFAGVKFMAETAKILNPSRTVVMPDLEAGCSLADGCPAADFGAFKARHPGHVVVTYINCSAEVKALSDIICTSSNAERIIRSIPREQPVIFAPDKNLGRFLVQKTGRDMVLWPGTCIVHETFNERHLIRLKTRNPGAEVIAHPECEEVILRHADFIGSTSSLLAYAGKSAARKFIVVTEGGILHAMRKAWPDREFIAAPNDSGCGCNECPHMKRNTLDNLYACLDRLAPEIKMDETLRLRALAPLERMMKLSA